MKVVVHRDISRTECAVPARDRDTEAGRAAPIARPAVAAEQ